MCETEFEAARHHHQAGRLPQAEMAYRAILALEPFHSGALQGLGVIALQTGQVEEAVTLISQVIKLKPNSIAAHFNLGKAHLSLQQYDDAETSFRRTVELDPDFAIGFYNLANVLRQQKKLNEAVTCYRRAVELIPDDVVAIIDLGNSLKDQGELDEAVAFYRRALVLMPNNAVAYNNLGNALNELEKVDEAITCYHRALAVAPEFVEAMTNLAAVLQDLGKLDEAVAYCRRALELKPNSVEAHSHLGDALKCQGNPDAAIDNYRNALAINPQQDKIHSNLVYTLLFCTGRTSAELYEEHRQWNENHSAPFQSLIQPHVNDRDPSRRLRIGYVSPDFRSHVVGRNLVPLFRNHDKQQFEIVCYSDVRSSDAITEKFRGLSDQWRDTARVTDQELTQLIRDDRIDILVDLTLHMANNRMLVFARKPAPLQVTFAGYPGTTGLTTIDYRLTDPYLDPPDTDDRFYSEKSVRLPNTFWCYDPLDNEPTVNTLPAAKNGYITFGCLNNFSKVNKSVLKLWAGVLSAVRNSRMIILAGEGRHRQQVLDRFADDGIANDRVTFVAQLKRSKYLRNYHQIDIGLDTVPYNGHTTSLDSFWMGVPVVTLVGTTVVGRAGLCQLTNLGLTELIAYSPEQFVSIATKLAQDLPRLNELRTTLRNRMQLSPLMDAASFAKNIEAAYREMWQRWCCEGTGNVRRKSQPTEQADKLTIVRDFQSALEFHRAGHLQQAESIYRNILAIDPAHADAMNGLGTIALITGRQMDAVRLITQAVVQRPESMAFYSNLGMAHQAMRQYSEAEAVFRRAMELAPDVAATHFNLANLLKQQQKLTEAVPYYLQAIRLRPDDASAYNNLGNCYREQGRLNQARQILARAIDLRPDYAEAHINLAGVLVSDGQAVEGEAHSRIAVKLGPQLAESYISLGTALHVQKRWQEAAEAYRRAVELSPRLAEAHENLGMVLIDLGQLSEAVKSYRCAVEVAPDRAESWQHLGNGLMTQLQFKEGDASFRRAVELQPDSSTLMSQWLFWQLYWPEVSLHAIAAQHSDWNSRFGIPKNQKQGRQDSEDAVITEKRHPLDSEKNGEPMVPGSLAGRSLRLGFVSADFGQHPIGMFTIRTIEALSTMGFDIVCYSSFARSGAINTRFKNCATLWREVQHLPDDDLAALINEDRVDILIDLAGHSAGNRLEVFARRPASVRATWIGSEGTTGLTAIDYLIADEHLVPHSAEAFYCERIVRLPTCYVSWDPPTETPAVSPSPAASGLPAKFCSFNNPAKYNDRVAELWSRILHRVPNSRLVLQSRHLTDHSVQRKLIELFSAAGIEEHRLEFHDWQPYAQLLEHYGKVDIALDPFPFGGGATTCDALWMGVPVVTWPGETFSSRHSASYLSAIGLSEFIAASEEDYIEIAVQLAEDRERLRRFRTLLRQRVELSPLCDGHRCALELTNVLQEMWSRSRIPG